MTSIAEARTEPRMITGAVATLELTRPNRRNAADAVLRGDLLATTARMADDDALDREAAAEAANADSDRFRRAPAGLLTRCEETPR